MKTTVDLPDELLHQAKIIAAQRRTTIKELIIQGLTHVTQPTPQDEHQKRRETMQRLVAGIKATNSQPMIPMKRAEIHDR